MHILIACESALANRHRKYMQQWDFLEAGMGWVGFSIWFSDRIPGMGKCFAVIVSMKVVRMNVKDEQNWTLKLLNRYTSIQQQKIVVADKFA